MHEFVRVVGVVTAVDPLKLLAQLSVADQLSDHRLHTCATDERTVAEALAHQIEYAGLLTYTQSPDAVGSAELDAGLAMLRQLHPTARRVPLGVGQLIGAATAGFDVAAARDQVNPAMALLPQRAEEAGVATLAWRRRRPLHPGRLYEALDELVPAAQRSRGRFWLANRPDLMLGWDAAGGSLAVEECGSWLASAARRLSTTSKQADGPPAHAEGARHGRNRASIAGDEPGPDDLDAAYRREPARTRRRRTPPTAVVIRCL